MSETVAEFVNAEPVAQRSSDPNLVGCRPSASQSQPDLLMMLKDAERLLSLDARLAKQHISEAIVFLEKRATAPKSCGTGVLVSGGLSPWQVRRLQERIEKDLDRSLTTAHLALTVKLSTGYFCHAFKRTFGVTPHAYISHARVKRAQEMMLMTGEPLSQIAVACGLADQSHLSRLFRKIVGQNPNSWRRANKEEHKSITAPHADR